MSPIDDTDRAILQILQENARTSNAEIGRKVGLGTSAIYRRIQKLEQAGVIRGYTAFADPAAVDCSLAAFIMIRTGEPTASVDTTARLADIPEVQEIHRVVGEDCFFVKVRVRDPEALARLLDERIQALPSVASTRTTIVLRTVKETLALPLASTD